MSPTPEQARRYERTLKGHLMRTYRNMLSRVLGIQQREARFYKGLTILAKEEFYQWALANPSYIQLHKAWVDADFARRLTPSIDRIDVLGGYTLNNMHWLTHVENSIRSYRHGERKGMQGARHPRAKLTASAVRTIRERTTDPGATLAQEFNVSKSTISAIRQRRLWKYLEQPN